MGGGGGGGGLQGEGKRGVCVKGLHMCRSTYVSTEVMETEQMRQVSSAIQDLDNQIEEQKLKIQNTANTSLRVSLTHSLSAHTEGGGIMREKSNIKFSLPSK